MELVGSRFLEKFGSICGIYATSRHNGKTFGRFFCQFCQQTDALYRRGGLSRGENAVCSRIGNLFHGAHGIGTKVECTVKRHVASGSVVHASFKEGDVHFAVVGECANNHSVGSSMDGRVDVVENDAFLRFGVEEVAAAWTDEHVVHHVGQCARGAHQSERRRDAAFGKSAAEFNACSAGFACREGTLVATATDFEIHVRFCLFGKTYHVGCATMERQT